MILVKKYDHTFFATPYVGPRWPPPLRWNRDILLPIQILASEISFTNFLELGSRVGPFKREDTYSLAKSIIYDGFGGIYREKHTLLSDP